MAEQIIFPSEIIDPAEIDWENPLTEGLFLTSLLDGSATAPTGQDNTYYNNATVSEGEDGTGVQTDTAWGEALSGADYVVLGTSEEGNRLFGNHDCSVLMRYKKLANTNQANIVSCGSAQAGTLRFNLSETSTGDIKVTTKVGSTWYGQTLQTDLVYGELQCVLLTYTAATGEIEVTTANGVNLTTTPSSQFPTSTDDILVGAGKISQNSPNVYGENLHTFMVSFWGRVLTDEEITSITSNPYQLFKTQETVQQEYGLVFPESTIQRVLTGDMDLVAGDTLTLKYTNHVFKSDSYLIDGVSTGGSRAYFYCWGSGFSFNSGVMSVLLDGVPFTSGSTAPTDGLEHEIVITITNTTKVGVLGNRYASTDTRSPNLTLKSFKVTGSNSRFWEFNQTTGSTVTDHYNGAVATLVNFPDDSGYVRENSELVGYQFDGGACAVVNLPTYAHVLWEFVCEFTLADYVSGTVNNYLFGAENSWSGNAINIQETATHFNIGNFGLTNNSILKSSFNGARRFTYRAAQTANGMEVTLNDISGWVSGVGVTGRTFGGYGVIGKFYLNTSTLLIHSMLFTNNDVNEETFNYDFTTGDSDQIIDTVGNNHATIVNTKTSGFMPIVPVDVYTVGTDTTRDYVDIVAWGSAVGGNVGYQKALCYGTQELTSDFDHRTDFLGGGEICGATGKFSGDFNDSEIAVITRADTYSGWLFDERTNQITYRNVIIDGKDSATFYLGSLPKVMDNVGVSVSANHESIYLTSGLLDLIIKDSHIKSDTYYSSLYVRNGKLTLSNTTFTGDYTGSYGLVRLRDCEAELVNNIVKPLTGVGVGNTTSTVTGSNNITSDSSAADLGIGTGSVDFTGAFADEASGDYRINQAWADTNLVGKGWNGSDIASWAYYTAVVDTGGTEQTIVVASTEQLTQAQIIDIANAQDANVIIVEQITQAQAVDISKNEDVQVIINEQLTHANIITTANVNNISNVITEQTTNAQALNSNSTQLIAAIQAQQLAQSIAIEIGSNGAQEVTVITTEQTTQSQAITASELNSLKVVISEQITQAINNGISQSEQLNVVTLEQITNAIAISIDDSSHVTVSMVQVEQLTQTAAAAVETNEAINQIITEQLTQFSTQTIDINLSISPIVLEQLTQAELITIIENNIADALNIDIDQITLEMQTPIYTIESLTPTYTIEMQTPIYTIEHLH